MVKEFQFCERKGDLRHVMIKVAQKSEYSSTPDLNINNGKSDKCHQCCYYRGDRELGRQGQGEKSSYKSTNYVKWWKPLRRGQRETNERYSPAPPIP